MGHIWKLNQYNWTLPTGYIYSTQFLFVCFKNIRPRLSFGLYKKETPQTINFIMSEKKKKKEFGSKLVSGKLYYDLKVVK